MRLLPGYLNARQQGKKIPHLAIILIGDDGASQTYVDNKVKACKAVGFHYTMMRFADTISEERLMKHIDHVNNDDDVDGFIVQLPLPDHISVEHITEKIRSDKDVDGFTNHNFGSIISKNPLLMPATPYGVMELLRRYNIETEGKHAVVVGASRIAGAPLSMMLDGTRPRYGDDMPQVHEGPRFIYPRCGYSSGCCW